MLRSNITNNKGNCLINGILFGDKSNLKKSNLQWPNQPSPNKKSWKLWSQTISNIYCINNKSEVIRHKKKLGHWIATHFQHSQFHSFLNSLSYKEIYHRHNNIVTQWFSSPITSQTINDIPYSQSICSDIPEDCFPIEEQTLKLSFTIKISHKLQKFINPIPKRLKEYNQQQPEWIQALTKHFDENQAVFPLFQYIQNNTPLIISSDGSKGERRSEGSWIIALEYGTHIVQGHNPNFSQISAINSYRAEIYASLAATLFLHLYSVYYRLPVKNNIHALCDNQAGF